MVARVDIRYEMITRSMTRNTESNPTREDEHRSETSVTGRRTESNVTTSQIEDDDNSAGTSTQKSSVVSSSQPGDKDNSQVFSPQNLKSGATTDEDSQIGKNMRGGESSVTTQLEDDNNSNGRSITSQFEDSPSLSPCPTTHSGSVFSPSITTVSEQEDNESVISIGSSTDSQDVATKLNQEERFTSSLPASPGMINLLSKIPKAICSSESSYPVGPRKRKIRKSLSLDATPPSSVSTNPVTCDNVEVFPEISVEPVEYEVTPQSLSSAQISQRGDSSTLSDSQSELVSREKHVTPGGETKRS